MVVEGSHHSYDEMCIAYLFYTEAYEPDETFAACLTSCGAATGECVLGCLMRPGVNRSCLLTELQTCGSTSCPTETSALFDCVASCGLSSQLACVENTQGVAPCSDELAAFAECMSPVVTAGT